MVPSAIRDNHVYVGSASSERDRPWLVVVGPRWLTVSVSCTLTPPVSSLLPRTHAQVHAKAPSELPSARAHMW